MSIFGPSYHDVWQAFSEEVGGTFERGGFAKASKMRVGEGPFTIALETYTISSGEDSDTYTRFRAYFREQGALRFGAGRRSFLSKIAALFGKRYVTTGHAAFDEVMVLWGNDEEQLKAYFNDARFCQLLAELRPYQLSIARNKPLLGPQLPEGVVEFCLLHDKLVKEPERLRKLLEVMRLALQRLVKVGIAVNVDPGLAP